MEIVDIERFEYNGELLFNPRDFGKFIGMSKDSIRKNLRRLNRDGMIILKNSHIRSIVNRKISNSGETFVTKDVMSELIDRSNIIDSDSKRYILKELLGIDSMVVTSTKESEFIHMLSQSLSAIDITGETQYSVLNYRIDFYIKELNVAIEYDENGHDHYTYEAHELREKHITDLLACKFIRVTDRESNAYNVGLVIKELLNIN